MARQGLSFQEHGSKILNMTRYARSGSTQKHKKMPGTATPWSEFSQAGASSSKKHKGKFRKNIKLSDKPSKAKFDSTKNFNQTPGKVPKTNATGTDISIDEEKSAFPKNDVSGKLNKKKNKFAKQHMKKQDPKESDDIKPEMTVSSPQNKIFEKKKSRYMEKLLKKRADQNMPLLPSKVERKLYNIKRKLREKNMPVDVLKEIIRKERRREELKFRKTFNPSKSCYNCRKMGHVFADCPEKSNSSGPSKQQTGICFKCGSSDHRSSKCPNKVEGYPFAKCFICKEQGHISRDCPSNTHGVYVKGGRCNLCGNVNHLRKDCPSLKIKNNDESSITLHTMNEVTSIDEEIVEKKHVKRENFFKKPKMVKF